MELTVFEQVSVAAEDGSSVSLAFEPGVSDGWGRLLLQVHGSRGGPSLHAAALSRDEVAQFCALLQQLFCVGHAERRRCRHAARLLLESMVSQLAVSYSNRGEPYREGVDIALTLAGQEFYAFVEEDAITRDLIPTLKRWLALSA